MSADTTIRESAAAVQDLLVGCCLQTELADVDSVVSGGAEPLRDRRRERVVSEELQATVFSGNSRSLTASAA